MAQSGALVELVKQAAIGPYWEQGKQRLTVYLAAAGMGASAALATGWSVKSKSGVASWLAPSTLAAPTPSPSDQSSNPATEVSQYLVECLAWS